MVEGGVPILCRAIGSNFVLRMIWTGKCIEARSADPSARSAEKIFHLDYHSQMY